MSRSSAALVVAALLVGFAARMVLIAIAPRYGFWGDHVEYVCWAREAVDVGPLALYDRPPAACPTLIYPTGEPPLTDVAGTGERLNYPPLAAFVLWVDGIILRALDPSRVANTTTARVVFAISTTIAEMVTAVGVAALVAGFGGPILVALAFAATWLAPPLLADGPFWGQTESWVLAPTVWMVWAMTRERWLVAGALWGVALALKPSGVLLAPLWAYAVAFRSDRLRVIAGGVVALLVLNVTALPFWLTSGVEWLRVSYLENYKFKLHWTTMMGFNVWYADLLMFGHLDSRTPLLGVARDVWGTALLLLGLLAAFALTRRWELRHTSRCALAFIPLAALVTLAAVTLPTRIHSTYNSFPAPFLIATACLIPRSAPAAAVMIVAGTLQILSWQWGNFLAMYPVPSSESTLPAELQAERRALRERDRQREWALTIVSLTATAAMFAGVALDPARAREGTPCDVNTDHGTVADG